MKVLDLVPESISASALKDGQMAVITYWNDITGYEGRVVQRYGQSLISLGMPHGNSWPNFFTRFTSTSPDRMLRVKLLPVGTKLEI